jgi:hypothetical protein
MGKPTEQDWYAIFGRAALEMLVCVRNGTLKLPLRIVITDGNDDLISEFELDHYVVGSVKDTALFPNGPLLDRVVFPITYTAVDSNGEKWVAVFSEAEASEFRRVS